MHSTQLVAPTRLLLALLLFGPACGSEDTDAPLDAGADLDGLDATTPDSATDDASRDAAFDEGLLDGNLDEDLGPAEDASTGRLPFPAEASGSLVGHYEIAANTSARVVDSLQLEGSLHIGRNATLVLEGGLQMSDDLTIEAGATISPMPRGRFSGWLLDSDSMTVAGTAESPVTLGNDQMGLEVRPKALDVSYGVFVGANMRAGEPGREKSIRDSRFIATGRNIIVDFSNGARIEHSEFERADLYLGAAQIERSLLDGGVLILTRSLSVAETACGGERDAPQDVTMVECVFDGYTEDDEFIRVARRYGPTSLEANYFALGVPRGTDWFHAWDGSNRRGCPDDDLGVYGGPLSVRPALGARPAVVGVR